MTRTILLLPLIFIGFSFAGLAQEMPKHENQVYIDENNRVYVNQEEPFYFYFSNSKEEGSKKYQIKSEVAPKLTDPVKFSEEGQKSITVSYTKSPNGGRMPVNLDIHIDGSAPESKAVFASDKKFTDDEGDYYGKDLGIDITAKDGRSMVDAVYYSLDGKAYQKFDNTLNVPEEGEHELKYYAVDNVGNVEPLKARPFFIDATPPESSHTVDGPSLDDTFSPETKIQLSASDDVTGVRNIKYAIDGASYSIYKEPIKLNSLEDGKHTISHYATDNLGLEEDKTDEANKLAFYLDLQPPEFDIKIEGTKYSTEGFLFIPEDAKLVVNPTDNHTGVDKIYYTVVHEGREGQNRTPLTEYNNGISFSESGKKTVTVRAFDKIGNVREKSEVIFMDNEKPQTGIKYGKPQIFTNDTLFITLTTDINLFTTQYDSGIKHTKFSINGGEEKIYNKNNVKFEKEGTYRLQYYSVDNVGNTEMKKTALFNIDNTAPTVELTVLGATPTYEQTEQGGKVLVFSRDGILKLDAKDRCGVKELYYWLNEGNKRDYSETRQIPVNEARNYNLKVQAIDNLGNSMTKEFIFYATD